MIHVAKNVYKNTATTLLNDIYKMRTGNTWVDQNTVSCGGVIARYYEDVKVFVVSDIQLEELRSLELEFLQMDEYLAMNMIEEMRIANFHDSCINKEVLTLPY